MEFGQANQLFFIFNKFTSHRLAQVHMRKNGMGSKSAGNAFTISFFWKEFLFSFLSLVNYSIGQSQSASHLIATKKTNFATFTSQYRSSAGIQSIKKNQGSIPADANFLDEQIPSSHAMEIFSKRTVDSKYFIDSDNPSIVYSKKSLGPMHYSKDGQWLTIDERVERKSAGILEASHLEEPVGFDIRKKRSYIRSFDGMIFFNDWSLYGVKRGKEVLLAKANWSEYSAGDDGVRVRNIFPGIDAEMQVFQTGIKTSFIVHKNQFANYETYIFKDFFSGEESGRLSKEKGSLNISLAGLLDYIMAGKTVLRIQKAFLYGEKRPADTYQSIAYRAKPHELSMLVPAAELNLLLSESDVIIDPFISIVNSINLSDILGSRYNADCSQNSTCNYQLTMPGLPGATVIDVSYSFSYLATPPCMLKDGAFNIVSGACAATKLTASTPDNYGPGAAVGVSIFSEFPASCFSPPSCNPPDFNFVFQFARTCKGEPGCDGACIGAIRPFTILIRGNVVLSIPVVKVTASSSAACSGDTIQFTADPINGGTAPSYQWLLDGMPVGPNSPVYLNSNLTSRDSISCIMTSSLNTGCPNNADTSGNLAVTIDPVPTLHIDASDSDICANEPVDFQAVGTNTGAFPAYQWLVNGVATGPNSSSFHTSALSDGDVVSASIIAQTGCTRPTGSDNLVTMIVRNAPVINPGPDFAIEEGQSIRLASTVSGNIANYSWSPSLGLDNATILNPVASPSATTLYQLVVTEVSGCMDSSSVRVKVLTPFQNAQCFYAQ